MCEGNRVELLMSFNFVEYFKLVQEALGFKARNADPLERPLYSHILYRWYIQRGSYRAGEFLDCIYCPCRLYWIPASIVMYQRARSLGQWERHSLEMRFMLVQQQEEAYALAINALSLLDSGDAWISLTLHDEEDSNPPEWRDANTGGFNDDRYADVGSIDIVELSDMRREFELCKARRELTIVYFGFNQSVEKSG